MDIEELFKGSFKNVVLVLYNFITLIKYVWYRYVVCLFPGYVWCRYIEQHGEEIKTKSLGFKKIVSTSKVIRKMITFRDLISLQELCLGKNCNIKKKNKKQNNLCKTFQGGYGNRVPKLLRQLEYEN